MAASYNLWFGIEKEKQMKDPKLQRTRQEALARQRWTGPSASFGATEIESDANDRHTFGRNLVVDPRTTTTTAEKRLLYDLAGPKQGSCVSSQPTGNRNTTKANITTTTSARAGRGVYSASRFIGDDEDPVMPGAFHFQGSSNVGPTAASPIRHTRSGGRRGRSRYVPGHQSISVIHQATPIAAHVVDHDEEAFEARVQERVQRESEEITRQFRNELAALENRNNENFEATNAEEEADKKVEDNESTCFGFDKWVIVSIIIFAFLLVGGACGIAAAVALTPKEDVTEDNSASNPASPLEPGPASTPGPSNSSATQPTLSPTLSQKCVLCADGTVPDDLEEKFVVGGEEENITCAEYATTTEALDANSETCGSNQALAWLYCGCPTLPPPVEDPPCDLCENGHAFVGPDAATCDELQRWAGIVATGYPVRSCESYRDAAAGCECPEGVIVDTSTPAPTPGATLAPTPASTPGATQEPGMCTLCADGTVPVGVDDNIVLDNSTTCAQFTEMTAAIDPNDEGCAINQAFAWGYCDCPTLPPPPENPVCTICDNAASPIGYNAVKCQDVQTFVGWVSISLPGVPCDVYTDAAGYCTCP